MALGAFGVNQPLIVQRACQVVVRISFALLAVDRAHVAVGTGIGASVDASLPQEGLKLRMLHLDLAHTGPRIRIIRKAESVLVHQDIVVVVQDGIRMHALQVEARQTCHARTGIEVILHMALAAGQVRRRNLFKVRSQGLEHIGVGHGDVARLIGVAGIAADALPYELAHIVEGVLIDLRSDLVHKVREVRRLAGPALGHRMGTSGLQDVVHVIEVASGTAVELGEAVRLIQGDKLRILLQVVRHLVVFLVLHEAGIDLGIVLFPVGSVQNRHARHGLDLFGDTLSGVLGFRNGKHRAGRRPVRRFRTAVKLTADQAGRNDSQAAYDAEDVIQKLVLWLFHKISFKISITVFALSYNAL